MLRRSVLISSPAADGGVGGIDENCLLLIRPVEAGGVWAPGDESLYARALTNYGATISAEGGGPWGGESRAIDHGNAVGYVGIPALALGDVWTVDCWCRASALVNYMRVFAYNGDSDNWFTFIRYYSSKFQIQSYDGADRNALSSSTPTVNTWYHLAGVFVSGGSCRLYVNGVLSATYSMGATRDLGFQFGRYLGAGRDQKERWRGRTCEFRVVSGDATADPDDPLYIQPGQAAFSPPAGPYTEE